MSDPCKLRGVILESVAGVLRCDCPRLLKDGSHTPGCPTNDITDVVEAVHEAVETLIMEVLNHAQTMPLTDIAAVEFIDAAT